MGHWQSQQVRCNKAWQGLSAGSPVRKGRSDAPLLLVAAGLLMGQQGEKPQPRVPLYAKQGPWKVHELSALRDVEDCCCSIPNFTIDPSPVLWESFAGPWSGHEPLLKRAGHRRERIVGVGTNQPDGADHQHQDHSQHDRIFGDILALIVYPKSDEERGHSHLLLESRLRSGCRRTPY